MNCLIVYTALVVGFAFGFVTCALLSTNKDEPKTSQLEKEMVEAGEAMMKPKTERKFIGKNA